MSYSPIHSTTLPHWIYLLAPILFFGAYFPVRFQDTDNFSQVGQLAILGFAAPCLIWFLRSKQQLLLGVFLSIYALAIEASSITTGFPYGFFNYGERIGYKVFDLVPWNVPFSWIPLFVGCLALSMHLTKHWWKRIIGTALGVVLVDLMLDPAAVQLDMWSFRHPGSYFDVPVTNFLGWFFSGIACGIVARSFLQDRVIDLRASTSLLLMLAFWSGACWWLGLWFPSFLGLILFIAIIVLASRSRGALHS
jgi:putative membrane protein